MAEFLILDIPDGVELADLLAARGVEFPCGGTSLCGGCRIRVMDGDVPATEEMAGALTDQELRGGWRLACRAHGRGRVTVEVGQWHTRILTDEAEVPVEPREGYGAVIDLGTTTLVAQLVDLMTGDVAAVRTGLNPQVRHGADVMSRVSSGMENPGLLTRLIRDELGAMLAEMAAGREIAETLVAGNTVMHHLFCGYDVSPLASAPFESPTLGEGVFAAASLGWSAGGVVRFLPCLGGFVGSDVLAGIVAVGLESGEQPQALVDLGTNGEIVVGSRHGMVCASTAAGPAFEAGRIRMGMRAATGAIDRVAPGWRCHVIGGGEPRGVCGSGLVDAVAVGLDEGAVLASGRLANGSKELPLAGEVRLFQSDVRELQLAKGAIAAGLELLEWKGEGTLHLAGAFGNYISVESAHRIGLLPHRERVVPAGNTSLRGTRMLLLVPSKREDLLERCRTLSRHVSLASGDRFEEVYANSMRFGG